MRTFIVLFLFCLSYVYGIGKECLDKCNSKWGYNPDAPFAETSDRPIEFLGAVICGQQCTIEDDVRAEERSHIVNIRDITKNIEMLQTRSGKLTEELDELENAISGAEDEVKAYSIKKKELQAELLRTHHFTGSQNEDCNSEKERLGTTISQLNATIGALEEVLISLESASESEFESSPAEINGVSQGKVVAYRGREGVLRIFQNVAEDMKSQRREASSDLHSWKHTCDVSMLSLENSATQIESQIAVNDEKLINANSTWNGALGARLSARSELYTAEDQLRNKTSELTQTQNMYENYVDTVKSEVSALIEGQRILTEFRRTTGGVSMEEARNLNASLVQIREHSYINSSPLEKAASLLASVVSKSSKIFGNTEKSVVGLNQAIQTLANRPGSENHPDKVRGQGFVERVLQMFIHLKSQINDEVASEITHYQWCEREIKKTKMHLNKSESRREGSESRLRSSQAKIEELTTSLEELQEEIQVVQETMAEAKERRFHDETRCQQTLEEMERKKRSFDKCVAYLHEFYSGHPDGMPSFLTPGEAVDRVSAKIIATINEIKNDEEEALALHRESVQESQKLITNNNAMISQKKQQLGFQQNDEKTFRKQADLHGESVENLELYSSQLSKPCFNFADDAARLAAFEGRQQGFRDELLAIDQATEILKNAYSGPPSA